jgi:iron complex outermembrane receptor protein
VILSAALWAATLAAAELPLRQDPGNPGHSKDLTDLSIEELMEVEITTPGRKEERLMDTPSAVFVIRPEDIRRSGARFIPEALRMAPGLEVARLDANKWAISSRGFNGRFANKLLVLMDGRNVYTPLFSGVYWDVQDTVLEDIERIEVIRGPGATMWGSNAVNGVINIITKPAASTPGAYLGGGVGTELRDFAEGRYGGAAGEDVRYRAYAKYLDHEPFDSGNDDWFMARAGFRTEWKAADQQTVTVLGDLYDGEVGDRVTIPILVPPFTQTFDQHVPVRGGNLLARWTLQSGPASQLNVQTWFESTYRLAHVVDERINTVDVSVDHRFSPIGGHDLVWGGEFRNVRDELDGSPTIQFSAARRSAVIGSGFLQDEITLVQQRLKLVLGCKVEYNTYARGSDHPVEVQPSVRVSWTPHEAHAVWAAASRAVRVPSRAQTTARLNGQVVPGPVEFAFFANRDVAPEELIALETGYRVQPLKELSIDIAGFVNLYDHLITDEAGTPFLETSPAPAHTVVPLVTDNKNDGRSFGVEIAVQAQPIPEWRIQAAYTFLQLNIDPESDSLDPFTDTAEHESPRGQFYLRSSWDLPHDLELDLIPRYVGALSSLGVAAYVELDARLAWHPWTNGEISLTGQNLLHRSHQEFAPSLAITEATKVERGGYLMVTVRF